MQNFNFNPGYSLSSVSPTNSRDIFNIIDNYSKKKTFSDNLLNFYKNYKYYIWILIILFILLLWMKSKSKIVKQKKLNSWKYGKLNSWKQSSTSNRSSNDSNIKMTYSKSETSYKKKLNIIVEKLNDKQNKYYQLYNYIKDINDEHANQLLYIINNDNLTHNDLMKLYKKYKKDYKNNDELNINVHILLKLIVNKYDIIKYSNQIKKIHHKLEKYEGTINKQKTNLSNRSLTEYPLIKSNSTPNVNSELQGFEYGKNYLNYEESQ